jgi:hypothetical protein
MDPSPPPYDARTPEPLARPPIASAPISVVLLAQGSTSEAAESVSAWQAYLPTLDRPFEIAVVQASSADADADANPVLAEVRSVDLDAVLGLGPALLTAICAAQYPLVLLAPADQQFQPHELQRLLGVIDHVDIALGCRTVHRPFWLRAPGWVFAMLVRIVLGIPPQPGNCTPGATPWRRRWAARWGFGVRLLDPESPFRLGRRAALVRIVLQSRGPFALVEQLAKANHLECMMTEEPVAWTPPPTPAPEPVSYAQEARGLFRRPDFGPPELHVPADTPCAAEPEAIPTKPEVPSS